MSENAPENAPVSALMMQMTEPVRNRLLRCGRTRLAEMYTRCFASTWDTTLERQDGTVFLITGDIPAMWLRDSSAQVFHYLPHASTFPEVREATAGLIRRQMQYICLDPYANAWNREHNGRHGYADRTSWRQDAEGWIWERKYEVDSLCYPIRLAYTAWKKCGITAWCDETFHRACRIILSTWTLEQSHEQSDYFFERSDCPQSDTLQRQGRGTPVGPTGMTWSGFRPSDDACRYGYLIPSNFFASVSLLQLAEMAQALLGDADMARDARRLREEILDGILRYGVVPDRNFGETYVYETDGLGNTFFMDDANVPSLLSLPYLGCVPIDDPIYRNTRRKVLSDANPYYYEGRILRGVGSPHTPRDYIWPISLCMQGLTSEDPTEILELLSMVENADAGTCLMHEGVHKDDPGRFTRPWFAWANSLFSEFVERATEVM